MPESGETLNQGVIAGTRTPEGGIRPTTRVKRLVSRFLKSKKVNLPQAAQGLVEQDTSDRRDFSGITARFEQNELDKIKAELEAETGDASTWTEPNHPEKVVEAFSDIVDQVTTRTTQLAHLQETGLIGWAKARFPDSYKLPHGTKMYLESSLKNKLLSPNVLGTYNAHRNMVVHTQDIDPIKFLKQLGDGELPIWIAQH